MRFVTRHTNNNYYYYAWPANREIFYLHILVRSVRAISYKISANAIAVVPGLHQPLGNGTKVERMLFCWAKMASTTIYNIHPMTRDSRWYTEKQTHNIYIYSPPFLYQIWQSIPRDLTISCI